ncbi:hypothetical protein M8494_10890 [Serratia ureilytica]
MPALISQIDGNERLPVRQQRLQNLVRSGGVQPQGDDGARFMGKAFIG